MCSTTSDLEVVNTEIEYDNCSYRSSSCNSEDERTSSPDRKRSRTDKVCSKCGAVFDQIFEFESHQIRCYNKLHRLEGIIFVLYSLIFTVNIHDPSICLIDPPINLEKRALHQHHNTLN